MPVVTDIICSTGQTDIPLMIDNRPSGAVLAINVFRNSTRTGVGAVATQRLFGGTFTKFRTDTLLRATCTVFGASYASGNSGVGLVLDENLWDYGVAYQYDGAWSQGNQTTIIFGTSYWTGIAEGRHKIEFGWNSINGTANNPFNVFNPSNADDVRNQQMISSIVVYEVYP